MGLRVREGDIEGSGATAPVRTMTIPIKMAGTPALCPPYALRTSSSAHRYSITLSAIAASVGGTVSPSALAVFRFIASSYLVGA
jgi:hypothetical protein